MFETIRRVGVFMICAQMVIHLKPNESYEKYLKLLMSIMVMVQIISPIMQLLGNGWDGAQFAERVRAYGKAMQGEKSGDNIADEADKVLEEYTMREISSRLEQQENERIQEAQEAGYAAEEGAGEEAVSWKTDAETPDTEAVERVFIDQIETIDQIEVK